MMSKNVPASKNPLYQGKATLEFDNLTTVELTELTDTQKAERFLSRWLEVMRPFTKYKRFFEESERETDHNLNLIKNLFLHYVVREAWSEKKFAIILDNVLTNRFALSHKSFETGEKLFNDEKLAVQLLEKKHSGRRKRL